jgi:hypothetical protein
MYKSGNARLVVELFHGQQRNSCVYPRSYTKEGKMEAYYVKYRLKREIKDPKKVALKNGRSATQGIYPACGTKIFRIGS